ncbi:unnamed protein product [Pieris macdunnoughi]|uniref:Uncharacterized protein n=1 Tax=Pieris macdunnoughi TaxID=345717 RepID=A0A821X2Z1_9NEOP|nr:unnamed protein product [Pieris macdunnoughi]
MKTFSWFFRESGRGKRTADGVGTTCKRTADGIVATINTHNKALLMTEKRVHKLRANCFYELMNKYQENSLSFCFDLQKVQVLPKTTIQDAYYSRQISLYNFCVVDVQAKNTIFYSWIELKSGRGAVEICSALYSFLIELDIPDHFGDDWMTVPELEWYNRVINDSRSNVREVNENCEHRDDDNESCQCLEQDIAFNNRTTVGPAAENLNSELSYEYVIPMCLTSSQNTLLTNQTKILEQLNSIQNVQTTTIQKIASLSVQLDHAMVQINNLSQNLQVTPLSACKSSPSNTAFYIKPFETVQQLDELELELSNSANRQQKKAIVLCYFRWWQSVEEKDHERRNDYETSENVDSNIDENENTEEEDEDHERD